MNLSGGGVFLSYATNPGDLLELEKEDLNHLLWAVGRRPNVASLSLQGNQITPTALATALFPFVQTALIRELNISMCGLGDQGAAALVRIACSNKAGSVQKLDMSFNGITAEGATAIAKALVNPKVSRCPIRSLALRYNPLTSHGVCQLISKGQLAFLDLRYCNLGAEPVDNLAKALRLNLTLKTVLLDGNNFTPEQARTIQHACSARSNIKGGLSLTRAAGPAPRLQALLEQQLQRHAQSPKSLDETERPGTTNATHQFLRSKRAAGELEPVLGELAKIEGPVAVVRRLQQPVSQKAQLFPAKSRRALPAEVTPIFGREVPRGRSPATARPAPIKYQCDEPPQLRASTARDVENLERSEAAEGTPEKERPYVPPLPPQIIPVSRSTSVSSMRSHRSAKTEPESRSDSMFGRVHRSSSQKNDTKSFVRKGRLVRMILERCLADDTQALQILNLPSAAKPMLRTSCGEELNVPVALLPYSAVPSDLALYAMFAPSRIGGIAKLLFLILHAPGDRLPLDVVQKMSDLPAEVRNLPIVQQANFRSQRNAENNEARRQLALALNISPGLVETSSSARPSSRAASRERKPPVQSRYLSGVFPPRRAVSARGSRNI